MVEAPHYRYFLAGGRALEAIYAHRLACAEAREQIQSFVMLCGADRALGGRRISGLHFSGKLPQGWVRNDAAPLMAIPDIESVRGMSLALRMRKLHIPGDSEFARMIGAEGVPSASHPSAALITVNWPTYEKLINGWAIKCPILPDGSSMQPPDCQPLTVGEYRKLLMPSFNLMAADFGLDDTSTLQ